MPQRYSAAEFEPAPINHAPSNLRARHAPHADDIPLVSDRRTSRDGYSCRPAGDLTAPLAISYASFFPFLAHAGATTLLKPLEHSTFMLIAARSNQELQHTRGPSLMSPFAGTGSYLCSCTSCFSTACSLASIPACSVCPGLNAQSQDRQKLNRGLHIPAFTGPSAVPGESSFTAQHCPLAFLNILFDVKRRAPTPSLNSIYPPIIDHT